MKTSKANYVSCQRYFKALKPVWNNFSHEGYITQHVDLGAKYNTIHIDLITQDCWIKKTPEVLTFFNKYKEYVEKNLSKYKLKQARMFAPWHREKNRTLWIVVLKEDTAYYEKGIWKLLDNEENIIHEFDKNGNRLVPLYK